MGEKIVVVDDEKEIADLVEVYLQNDNYDVRKFYNGEEALESIWKEPPDLAVLDVMLPDLDGFSLCKKIREKYYFPIIMLTAKEEPADKIAGLTFGADDYITKPFNPLELTARVRTQLRRCKKYNAVDRQEVDCMDIRSLHMKKSSHSCVWNGKTLSLTPLEFEILWYLCERRGSVVSSEELFEKVWGEKFLDQNNTVMAHIARLREKMNEPARKPVFIKTVWGVGYTVED